MAEDRSLDEFVRSDESDGDDERDAGLPDQETDRRDVEDGEADSEDPRDTSESVDPISPTYATSTRSDACAKCGSAVEERWRDGDDLVCGDCKEW